MIGLDTNLVVRLVVGDDPEQAEQVDALLDRCSAAGIQCLLTLIVLSELEWVLTSSYGVPRPEIAAAVRRFLADPLFVVEERAAVEEALESYQAGKGDLSDHLLGARARTLGARTTFTFDRALRDAVSFTLLS